MLRGPRDWGVPADPWNVLEATATSGTTLPNKIRVITEGGGSKHFQLLVNQSGEATRTDCLAPAELRLAQRGPQMEVWGGFPL